jgi:glycosyltransferase involved in cell wall biosynthesis
MISCLTVTLPISERFEMLKRSIAAYQVQTFLDRELVVVVNMNSSRGIKSCYTEIKNYIDSLNNPSIRCLDIQGQRTLGELRNISVSEACGDIICQWDDDDIFHPMRLEEQFNFLQSTGADANILAEILLFFSETRELFYTNWSNTPYGGMTGSLMCRKSSVPEYPTSSERSKLGEDSYIVKLLNKSGRIHYLKDKAYLFTYVSHSSNSWSAEFFNTIQSSLTISKGLFERKKEILFTQISALQMGSEPIVFKTANGDAYTYIPGDTPLIA